jgi:hypothetical protein
VTPVQYAVLDLYLGAFAARHDAFVKDSRAHIAQPLTPEVAYAATGAGGFSISGYMATFIHPTDEYGTTWMSTRDCLTHVGAIDFDMDDGFDKAKEVRAFLAAQHSIESLLVGSRRGAHLWVQTIGDGKHGSQSFGMVPASVMRRALHSALSLCGIDSPKAEVFPKQSDSDWGVGALRMPLMRHPKTGVRYPAYDPFDDREITGLTALVNLMADLQTPYAALYGLAGPEPASVPYPHRTGLERPFLAATGDAPLVSDLLAREFGLHITPGRSLRCPFHPDQHASLSVADDDLRVWCKAPECPIYNGDTGMGSIALAAYLGKEMPDSAPRHPRDTHGVQDIVPE